jgi:hypothetical protein
MSLKKFELKEDHIKIIKHITFKTDAHTLRSGDDNESPFGNGDFYDDLGLIIYGNINPEFDPLSDETPSLTSEQKMYLEDIFQGIPTALEIVLNSGHREPGHYKRKHHALPSDWVINSKI